MVKYISGKYKIGDQIASTIFNIIEDLKNQNIRFNNYCEPFLGMASVLKNIIPLLGDKYTYCVGDAHEALMMMWQDAKKGKRKSFPEYVDRNLYEELKSQERPSATKGFVGFQNSFRGSYFVGAYFDQTPNNRNKIDEVMEIGRLMNNSDTKLSNCDYSNYSNLKNSIIYLDPPYGGVHNEFSDENGHIKFDYKIFWNWIKNMSRISKNNIIFLSEYNVPEEYINKVSLVWEDSKGKEKLFMIIP